MTRLAVVAALCLATLAFAEPITLATGAQRTLTVPGLSRVAVGDAEVCDVRTVGGGQLLLVAKKAGKTTVHVWGLKDARSTFEVTVTGAATGAEDATPGAPGTELRLAVGASRTLTFPGLTRTAIGDSDVADVKLAPNAQLTVIARKPGVTTLLTWTAAGQNPPVAVVVGGAPAPAPRDVTPAPAQTLSLKVGTRHVVTIPGLARVAVGDADVADVQTLGNDQLAILPRRAGVTTLLAWDQASTVTTYRLEVKQ